MAVTRTQAHTESIWLGNVVLYRDELEKIIHAVAEVGEPTIEGHGFVATSADDLAEETVPEQLDFLEVRASRGEQQITVVLWRDRAEVELVEPDTHLYGVASRIEDVCAPVQRRRTRIPWRVYVVAVTLLLLQLLGIWFVGQLYPPVVERVGPDAHIDLITLVATEGSFVLVLSAIRAVARREGAEALLGPGGGNSAWLINAYRVDRPSFWLRNRDSIWITAASLVLGALLGVVANELAS